MNSTRKIDIIAGILFICIAALIIWVAIPYGVQEPKKVKFVALSPSYYPRLVGYCLLGFGLLLVITRSFSSAPSDIDNEKCFIENWVSVLVSIVATLAAYYLSLEYLGFVLASAIAVFILLLLAGERKPVPLIAIPLLLPTGLHLFFTKVANIPIPSGVMQPILGGA